MPGNKRQSGKRYLWDCPFSRRRAARGVIHFVPQPLSGYAPEQLKVYSWALLAGMAVLAVLMVSRIRYTSFQKRRAEEQ